MPNALLSVGFFFFNDTATTEIYTLSLHDALPICGTGDESPRVRSCADAGRHRGVDQHQRDSQPEIGRAHHCTAVTSASRMSSSAWIRNFTLVHALLSRLFTSFSQ